MSGERVLVVDDNPQNLKLARVILTRAGYEVVTAADAEEASTLIEASAPALVLMDIQLPRMDGIELTQWIKADPSRRSIQVLALTAYAMKGDRERLLAAGCDEYMAKPIDTEALCALVRLLLDRVAPSP